MLALGAGAIFALGRRQRLGCFEVLLLAAAGVLAFRSRRDLWFLVVAAAVVLAGSPHPRLAPGARFILTPRRLAVVAAALAGLIVLVAWKRDLSAETLQQKVAGVFPVEAAAIVA